MQKIIRVGDLHLTTLLYNIDSSSTFVICFNKVIRV